MFDNFRKLLKRNDQMIPLPEGYDSEVFAQVLDRSISPDQQTSILRTTYHLSRLWSEGDTAQIPRALTMVDENYPHLERMADLEIFSQGWLAELKTVIQLTADSREVLLFYPKEFRQLLYTALENLEPE